MFAKLFHHDNRASTLWGLKRLVTLISLVIFVVNNWGSNLAVSKFLWLSFIARTRQAPLNAFYVDVNQATTDVASSMGLLTACVAVAWIICLIINVFVPAYLTEAELNTNRAKAAKYYQQIARETQGLEAALKTVEENKLLRTELAKLREDLQEIRVEASAIKAKRSQKANPDNRQNAQDLFTSEQEGVAIPKKARAWRLKNGRRRPPAPKF